MAAGDLIGAGDATQFMGIPGTQDQALIGSLITGASQYIYTRTGRRVLGAVPSPVALTEIRDGNDSDVMVMKEFPIVSVQSVTVSGAVINASTNVGAQLGGYGFDDHRIFILPGTWSASSMGMISGFVRGRQNVVIAYTAGPASVPADLFQACVEIVSLWYQRRRRQDMRSKSNSTSGQVNTFAVEMEVPTHVDRLIESYSRKWPVR